MKVSDYIVKFLVSKGIDTVYEMAGGMITHILDSLNREKSIQIISVHHEQAAAFAADAHGRVSNKPGVAMATSGPGATNLLTGIGSCYFDSSPAIFITGQVNTYEQKANKNIRQLGFQETDIVPIASPITKLAVKVEKAEEIPELLEKAYKIALCGRPGPVLIDIPMNIQRGHISVPNDSGNKRAIAENYTTLDYNYIFESIRGSQKPLILAGRGIRAANALKEFGEFVSKVNVPVVLSLLGLDALSFDNPNRVGFIGSYGNRWANILLGECDLLIVIGSRLDIRQTGADIESFKQNKKIIHIDCEEGEINNRINNSIKCLTDVKSFLLDANQEAVDFIFEMKQKWFNRINSLKDELSDLKELNSIKGINPNLFIKKLSEFSVKSKAFIADVGNHQMWSAQSLRLSKEQLFITSGGMGAMGFALPASIGVCLALNRQAVVIIAGDGGFQLNIQELQTIVANDLPIKIVVLNNNCLGMIRQFQDSYFESKYQSTYWGYSAPDFAKLGEAYGLSSKTINNEQEIENALTWLWEVPNKSALLQVMIDMHTNAYPKLAFGRPISEMEPLSKPLDIEGT